MGRAGALADEAMLAFPPFDKRKTVLPRASLPMLGMSGESRGGVSMEVVEQLGRSGVCFGEHNAPCSAAGRRSNTEFPAPCGCYPDSPSGWHPILQPLVVLSPRRDACCSVSGLPIIPLGQSERLLQLSQRRLCRAHGRILLGAELLAADD